MDNRTVIICDCDHKDIAEERRVFSEAGVSFDWLHCKTQAEVIHTCKNVPVLLNQYVTMDKTVFEALPELECIVRYGVGVDNVNLEDATRYGIQVCNVPDYGTQEVADHAFAHMMALTRKVYQSTTLVKQGIWDYTRGIPIRRFRELTIGICGVGRIGSEFAKRARAFGARIIGYDPEYGLPNRTFPDFVQFVSFETLLTQSDVISIHAPLNADTYHLFSIAELQKMKTSAYLINVSRGGIIDEDALAQALAAGEIAGAGIDVAEREPMPANHPLLQFDNFLVSPHTAWYSVESASELKTKAAMEAVRYLNGEPVHYPVNRIQR